MRGWSVVLIILLASACGHRQTARAKSDGAFDYRVTLGRELADKYCFGCHDSHSSAERVSNHDNLTADAHAFSEDVRIPPAELTAIITQGGTGAGRSREMPPYGRTLTAPEIEALVVYIRTASPSPAEQTPAN